MTAPPLAPPAEPVAPWDAPVDPKLDPVSRLSRLVAGNDKLATQPGLVQALFEQNATPAQASAINEFVVGLDAEKAVRTAAASGNKISLSQRQRNVLDAMGIDYQPVWLTPQDAVSELKSKMAAKGLEPVIKDGQVQVDKSGNVLARRIQQPQQQSSGGRGFFGSIGHYLGSVVLHGDFSGHNGVVGQPEGGVEGLLHVASSAYNLTNAAFSETAGSRNPAQAVATASGNADLMRRLGYDPDSVVSTLAFEAKGYAHNDTDAAARSWDNQNPNGLFGWDGRQAVTEAETFAANPTKYQSQIVNDPTLNPTQVAEKIKQLNSEQFQSLVARVSAEKADVGTDFARGIGIDPVAHPKLFNYTAAGVNFAASFAIDPTATGLSLANDARIGAAAIRNVGDTEEVLRMFRGPAASMGVASSRADLHAMVQYANQLRDARDVGDTVAEARILASADKNPYAPLLEDFTGANQITLKSEAELANLPRGELPFRAATDEEKLGPIDTYDKAVDYIASKRALLKLNGGYAPTLSAVMPGALSSYGYGRLRAGFAGWTAGISASRGLARSAKFLGWAEADPEREAALIKQGLLTRYTPSADDAVDVLSGRVLAAQERASTARTAQDMASAEMRDATRAYQDLEVEFNATGKVPTEKFVAARERLQRAQGYVRGARTEADTAQEGLASAQRALDARRAAIAEGAPTEAGLYLTPAGTGQIRRNMLTYGRAVKPESLVGRVVAAGTLGVAQRAQLAASRFLNWLPRDTVLNTEQASSVDTFRKMARLYLTRGDSNLLAARYVMGSHDTRKAMIEALQKQLFHASGAAHTKLGHELEQRISTENQKYSLLGDDVLDANGQAAALIPGQVQTKFYLPSFGALQRAAAKVGLFEASIGRLSSNPIADMLLTQWKIGALFTPVTAMRATIESWLNAGADHMLPQGLRAKAWLRDQGLLEHPLTHRSRPVNAILSLAPLALAGRFYRHLLLARMPYAEAEALAHIDKDLLYGQIAEQSAMHYAAEVDPAGVGDVTRAAEAGFTPGRVRYNSKEAWNQELRSREGYEITHETEGVRGAGVYAHNLATWVNDSPKLAHVLADRVENPGAFDVQDVVKALDAEPLMQHTLYGKVFWREDGSQANAITESESATGKEQWAEKVTSEFRQLVTGQNGTVQKDLLGYVRTHGRAPDADWILDHIKGLNRPASLLKPIFTAVPQKEGPAGLAQEILDAEGKGYQWLVERLIQRHATSPLFLAAYGDSKVGLEGFKQGLIAGGYSEVAAERAAQVQAAGQAWARVARMLDDPHMKSQMDIVGRSFFAFSRATTMMLRRWSTTFWRNPVAARRAMLAAEAADHSGLVYQDENGQWMFSFPGSGVAQEVLLHAMSHFPGLQDLVRFPTSDFEGRVASIIPGSNNPFQYQTTPMMSIAMRDLGAAVPLVRDELYALDKKLNGEQGAGQGFVATLEPNLAKKVSDVFDGDPRNSMTASAVIGALFNMYAAGQVPADGASPRKMDDFWHSMNVGARSVLFLRSLMGALSPASVAQPLSDNAKSASDYAFAASGVQDLRDEFRQIVNEVGGDWGRATAIWTALHPHLTVYEQSASQSTTPKAFLPSTDAAYTWMSNHAGFIDKYKDVAAYFLPPPTGEEPFSMDAYRLQLESGLRERKTPGEFLDGVRIAAAADEYYPAEDSYKKALAQAKAAGDVALAQSYTRDWLAWSKKFKATHYTFSKLVDGYGDQKKTAKDQFRNLQDMVKSGDVPGSATQQQAVANMVQAYQDYEQFLIDHPGTDAVSKAQHSAVFAQLQDFLSRTVAVVPSLSGLYNGVFRTLNSNLDPIQEATP